MKVAELNDLMTAIEARQDLINFISALRHDLAADPAGWENLSLDHYLDALAA